MSGYLALVLIAGIIAVYGILEVIFTETGTPTNKFDIIENELFRLHIHFDDKFAQQEITRLNKQLIGLDE